jgi:hypothetical protein
MTARADRKRAELRAKVHGLEREFGEWRTVSEAGETLEKHHRQIRAVLGLLDGAVGDLRERIDAEGESVLGSWSQTEERLLRIHGVWDFFREKLALRHVGLFRPHLALADEFAAACYLPAQVLGTDRRRLREPPLCFFSEHSTPFALPRGAAYTGTPAGVLTAADLRVVADELPIPVIGLPWCQLDHLPDALVIGHEVGHHVEDDFRLTGTITGLADQSLADAGRPSTRRLEWQGWLGEVFADVYGVLAAGPGFATALADFVPTSGQAVTGDRQYPPMAVRVEVAAAALRRTGFAEPAQELVTRWQADFGAGPETSYAQDVDVVVEKLLAGPYTDAAIPLTGVLCFADRGEQTASTTWSLLKSAGLSEDIDVRVLLSAAATAFARDPRTYLDQDLAGAVLRHAQAIEHRGLRAAGEQREPAPPRESARPQPAAEQGDPFAQALRGVLRM